MPRYHQHSGEPVLGRCCIMAGTNKQTNKDTNDFNIGSTVHHEEDCAHCWSSTPSCSDTHSYKHNNINDTTPSIQLNGIETERKRMAVSPSNHRMDNPNHHHNTCFSQASSTKSPFPVQCQIHLDSSVRNQNKSTLTQRKPSRSGT